MTADGQRDLPSGALNLVGELHAGGRRADDEDAAGRQLFGTSVVRGHDLRGSTAPARGSRRARPADPQYPVGHDHGSADQPAAPLVTTRKPVPRSFNAAHGRVGERAVAAT